MNIYDLKDVQVVIPSNKGIQKLYVELTSDCNFSCEMCFRHNFPDSMGSMSSDLLKRLCNEIETLPELKEVLIGGIGEPFLHPNLSDFTAFIKKLGKSVAITSNGSLTADQLDFIVTHKIDNLYLSCETGTIGHSNEDSVFNLCKWIEHRKQELGSRKPAVHLSMVITRQNINDLTRIAKRLRGSGIRTLFFSNLLPVSPNQQEQVLYPGQEPVALQQLRSELLQRVLLDKIRCSVPKFEIKTERFCEFVEQKSLVVRWDGAVSPCYRFLHSTVECANGRSKEIKAAIFGHLSDSSLLEIWNDRDYAWFRYQVHNSIYPSCVDCQLKDGCQFIKSTESDCWGNENSCADCLWARGIIRCP